MIDREAVVRAVAERYGTRISEDDPLLAWLAVHDVVLDQYVQAWRETQTEAQAAADERAAELESASKREAAARQAAVETAARDAAKAAVAAIEGGMGEAIEAFRLAAGGAAETVNAGARRAQVAAMLAAAFPLAALVGIVAWLTLS